MNLTFPLNLMISMFSRKSKKYLHLHSVNSTEAEEPKLISVSKLGFGNNSLIVLAFMNPTTVEERCNLQITERGAVWNYK